MRPVLNVTRLVGHHLGRAAKAGLSHLAVVPQLADDGVVLVLPDLMAKRQVALPAGARRLLLGPEHQREQHAKDGSGDDQRRDRVQAHLAPRCPLAMWLVVGLREPRLVMGRLAVINQKSSQRLEPSKD